MSSPHSRSSCGRIRQQKARWRALAVVLHTLGFHFLEMTKKVVQASRAQALIEDLYRYRRLGANRSRGLRFQANPVIDRVPQALFAPKVSLSRLDGHMAEEKLDLFEFASSLVAESGTGSTQVVKSDCAKPAI
jgi:hypothetical protein